VTTDRIASLPPAPTLIRNHFSVSGEKLQHQMPVWRDRVGHILDVPISRAQIANGFNGSIDTYLLKDLLFLNSRTDPLVQARSAARISTDNMRDYVFHIVMEGSIETVTGLYPQRKAAQTVPGILALDMGQTMRMERPACRVLAFFLPRALVESMLPDAESIHGRVVEYTSPLTKLILNHLIALDRDLSTMNAVETERALRVCIPLIVAAFGKQTRLSGNAGAAARAAMFGQARRYIRENLHEPHLSPESVLHATRLTRSTLYRLFEHEGGLGAYIRDCRLREAADELVRFPHRPVMDIAYGLGFKSPSDFTHAFRRAYDAAPMDFRAQALQHMGGTC
jgi:AraC-like DNA-binding protein